jgi:phosphate transport system substrate-binding protein
MRAKGNEGVAGLIQNSAGSIGYVGYEFARRIGLNVATLENKSGDFIKPSPQSCAAGLATVMLPDNLRAFVPDPDGSDSYPVVTLSWILLRKSYQNHDTAKALGSLLQWSLHDGQNYASELGYVPLPSAVVDKAAAAVSTISP